VEAYLKNPSTRSRDVTFSVVLPDSAFVSNFSMILQDDKVRNHEGAIPRRIDAALLQCLENYL